MMSGAGANAQSLNAEENASPNPRLFRTPVSSDDDADACRPHVATKRLLDGDAHVRAQNPAPPTKPRDSVVNGVLIGAGIGTILGLIPDYYDDCEECHDSLYASIAVGAGIGLIIDLLRSDKRPTSPSTSDRRTRLGIVGGRKAFAIRGAVAWR
jgi:hypothetical protein